MLGFRLSIAGLLLAAATGAPTAAREPDSVLAVEPGGAGVLTKCRDWLVTTSCNTYHHIDLPPRIAVGDTISVSFGSRPKEFRFFCRADCAKGPPLRDLQRSPRRSARDGQDQRRPVLSGEHGAVRAG